MRKFIFILCVSCLGSSNESKSNNTNNPKNSNYFNNESVIKSNREYIERSFKTNLEQSYVEIFSNLKELLKNPIEDESKGNLNRDEFKIAFFNAFLTANEKDFKDQLFQVKDFLNLKEYLDSIVLESKDISPRQEEVNNIFATLVTKREDILKIFNEQANKLGEQDAILLKFYTLWRLFLGSEQDIFDAKERVLSKNLESFSNLDLKSFKKNIFLFEITFELIDKDFLEKDVVINENKRDYEYFKEYFSSKIEGLNLDSRKSFSVPALKYLECIKQETLLALSLKDEADKALHINKAFYLFKNVVKYKIRSLDPIKDRKNKEIVSKYIAFTAFIAAMLD